MEEAEQLVEVLEACLAEDPGVWGVFVVVDPAASPPTQDARELLAGALSLLADRHYGVCVAIPGTGVGARSLRTLWRIILSFSQLRGGVEVVTDTEDAIAYLVDRAAAKDRGLVPDDLRSFVRRVSTAAGSE